MGIVKKGASCLKTALLAVIVCHAAVCTAKAAAALLIPAREWTMIRQIAVNYDLTDEQTWKLAAIRRYENGRPGLEFGIGGPMNSGHRAHRYRDGVKSFYVQGSWAAGTLKRNAKDTPLVFAARYCPLTPRKWKDAIDSLISRLKAENKYKLPGKKPGKRDLSFP